MKETLYRQTGAGPKRQKHAFRRLGRYGITPEKLWEYALKQNLTDSQNREIFLKQAEIWAAGPHTAAWAALEAHLLDEKTWGILTEEEALDAQKCLWEGFFCRREKRKGRIEETELLRWIVEEIKG